MEKKQEMRLVFEDSSVKEQLQELASVIGLSLNQMVNHILSAQFSNKSKLMLQLWLDLAEFKKSSGEVG